MARSLPHDITNALAAAALVMESGLVGVESVAAALRDFEAPVHRLQFVAEVTAFVGLTIQKQRHRTPHQRRSGLPDIGPHCRWAQQDLDLTPMAVAGGSLTASSPLASGSEISDVFGGMVEVVTAGSWRPQSTLPLGSQTDMEVVLSPGCASSTGIHRVGTRHG